MTDTTHTLELTITNDNKNEENKPMLSKNIFKMVGKIGQMNDEKN